MYPQQIRQSKLPLIAASALLVLIAAGLTLLVRHNHAAKAAAPAPAIIHYDANSGKTVRTIPGEQNTNGTSANAPYYLGAEVLLQHGMTSDQLTNLEKAFYQYSQINNLGIKQVSINPDTFTTGILNQGTANQTNTADFNVVFDSKTTVHAQARYSGLDSAELFLTDSSSGKQLYDSGVLGG